MKSALPLMILHSFAALVLGSIVVDWNTTTAISNTTATLQVVVNPVFNEATTPVAKVAWESLANLSATHVRFAAWFPYPQWSVPELFPPHFSSESECTTSWNFTGLLSQLLPFLRSVKSAVVDISTLPEWFFAAPSGFSTNVSSNAVDWGYTYPGRWMRNSTQQAAEYFARISSFLILGNFTDECGQRQSGGPRVPPQTIIWEVFNEPEAELRGAGPNTYVATFDAIVSSIREAADPMHLIQFQGLALEGHGEWNWWRAFLDPSNHVPEARDAINYASFHFYSVLRERVDNSTWEWEFFDPAEDFAEECRTIVRLRDSLSPHTKLNADECGTIAPDDNAAGSPVPSELYYLGSAATYAYTYAVLSEIGVDVVGESQLGGVPVVQEWSINQAQYPSVSMLNWTTGRGNARYHVLHLILQHFAPGDRIHRVSYAARPVMCGARWNYDPLGLHYAKTVTLQCAAPNATISSISFAHVGDFLGDCVSGFKPRNASCSDTGAVLRAVKTLCLNRTSCAVSLAKFAGETGCSTYRLVVVGRCDGPGFAVPSAYPDDRVFVQARTTANGSRREYLLVNRNNNEASVSLPGVGVAQIVDSNDGPQVAPFTGTLLLRPFATAVVTLSD
jgi:hypothetical protein